MRNVCCLLAVAGVACLWSAGAAAQTKFSATASCGGDKSDVSHELLVGDRSDHRFGLVQFKCSYTKPMDIGGDKSEEALVTVTYDDTRSKSHFRGMQVVTLESGNKIFAPFQGTQPLKDGKPGESHGSFIYSGGTGKMKGIKGKGTFKCVLAPGKSICYSEGEYQFPK